MCSAGNGLVRVSANVYSYQYFTITKHKSQIEKDGVIYGERIKQSGNRERTVHGRSDGTADRVNQSGTAAHDRVYQETPSDPLLRRTNYGRTHQHHEKSKRQRSGACYDICKSVNLWKERAEGISPGSFFVYRKNRRIIPPVFLMILLRCVRRCPPGSPSGIQASGQRRRRDGA